tara:strand:+ start:1729 stop:2007 length:279 start_codon:yes stop_codon:yes gene_type:complete
MLELNGDVWKAADEGGYYLEDMHNMRMATALIGLKLEAKASGLKFTRISSFKVLKEYFHGLKKSKKDAYDQLVEAGIYEHYTVNTKEDAPSI